MAFRISELSGDYYALKRRMQRARRLYVLFCRKALEAEGTDALRRCAKRMILSRLKLTICLADAEYTILRNLFFIEHGKPYRNGKDAFLYGRWHEWLHEKGWERSIFRGDGWIKRAVNDK